ncbi:MAG: T9SS type A sorting domain-containing protein [Phycisphaerae bacterium]|nr:T9SS type A sorting domain-containing protein [Saprospiraceae bacterium]
MKKGFLVLFFAFMAILSAFGQQLQQPICGNAQDQADLLPQLRENKIVMEALRAVAQDRGEIKYVPIHFHLVGDVSGNGKHKEIKVLEQLCALNAAYLSVGIQFYLSPHPTNGLFDKSINNDGVYKTQTNSLIMSLRRHHNAVNVYVVLTPVSGNVQVPGTETLAYYSPSQDWIVTKKTETNGDQPNSTLPHEMGHLFSLPHTFYGYESDPFDAADAGWPIAPVLAPNGGGVTTERQNGTNCATAADEICDTPPDYNFGLIWPGCSSYTGGAKDPLGTLVNPMENNFMGYFNGCMPYAFTQDQIDIINADLISPSRNYLDNTFAPVATAINTPAKLLVSPDSAAVTPYYNNVLLEWQAVPGATHYLVELDVIPNFGTANAQTYYETGTSKLLTSLLSNKKYYWRVKPFNYLVGCAAERASNFKTSTISATVEIEGLSAWQLSPNPVTADGANLKINAEKAFEAGVRITDAAGRTVSFQQNLSFPQGESNYELHTEGLANGLYFVTLESGDGRNVLKMSVLR